MSDATSRLNSALEGRYHVEREIGEGGMATVYLAADLRHERKVALKVLKPELAAVVGADRFLSEIKTTANLQHPHILPLFDSGEADGFLYYVMPYIDGETLRAKLDRETQFGIDESVRIACEVADALHYAHRGNVIHRDVKPENILVQDGRAVIADFGIALAVSAAGGRRMTETGLSLGTPHYMSPEQATAEKELSHRSDVYSLGCVLYEMLAGDPPHTGASAQQVVMKIVTDEARPLTELRKSVPANVAAATAKALEKLPADRFENADAFAKALKDPHFTVGVGRAPAVGASSTNRWKRTAIGATTVAAIMAFVALWGWLRPEPRPVSRYSVALAAPDRVAPALGPRFALSPDGSRVVYVGFGDQGTQLLVRPMDRLRATPLSGTEGASQPFFSPSGDAVGFFVGTELTELRTVSLSGGNPITVATGVPQVGASWGPDGFIYLGNEGPLLRVPASGGTPQPIATLEASRGETMHSWPHALPGGVGVLFTTWRGNNSWGTAEIAALDLTTGAHTVLGAGLRAWYTHSGHLVSQVCCITGETAVARFDEKALRTTGDPVAMGEILSPQTFYASTDLALSNNGTLMYVTPSRPEKEQVVWVTRDGTATPIEPGWWGEFASVKLSPDESELAVTYFEANTGRLLGVKNLESGALTRLSVRDTADLPAMPAAYFDWAPGGDELIFDMPATSGNNLVARRADDSGETRMVLDLPESIRSSTWSQDGEWLVFTLDRSSTGLDIFGFRPGVDSEPTPMVVSQNDESAPALSPNGHWLAHSVVVSGRSEVFVRPFPNTDDWARQVSVRGGASPLWAPSGAELFFLDGDGNLVSVSVRPGAQFVAETPDVLFSALRYDREYNLPRTMDVTHDGSRFVMIRRADVGDGAELIVVENWFEELKAQLGN